MADLHVLDSLDGTAAISSNGFTATTRPYGTNLELVVASPVTSLLPDSPNRVTVLGEWRAIWLAPSRWLLAHPAPDQPAPTELVDLLATRVARIIDVSCARAEFVCEGQAVREIFGKCTPLDLRPDRFGAGQCARTWFSGFPAIIEHRGTEYSLFVEAPLAAAFREMLVDAAC